MDKKYPIAEPSIAYTKMESHWDLILDLLGGTVAMRDAAGKWLPQEPAESFEKYDARLNRSILYGGLADTLEKLSSRPFSHPISVTDMPEALNYLLEDVDSTGKSLETLAQELLYDLAEFGKTHIFVDHSEVPQIVNGDVTTIKDEEEAGARVLIDKISPKNLIGWQTQTIGKRTVLTQIRVKEIVLENDGDYGDAEQEYIRVWNSNNTWERYKKVDDKWLLAETGVHTFNGIPLITIYANRKGFMIALPPLENLAWLNLAHWQSYSDQRNILRLSRFGILYGKGFPADYAEGKKAMELGPSVAYLFTETEGDLKYVEHKGSAIEAGAKDIADIEVKMELLGQQPLIRSVPNSTATAKRIDENRNISQLQAWIRNEENGLIAAIKLACKWRNIEPPETLAVDIYSDFEATLSGGADKDHLLKMRQAGEISRVTYLKEVKRRGVLADDVDPTEEAALIEDEEGKDGLEFEDVPSGDSE